MIHCVLFNPTIDKIDLIPSFHAGGTYKVKETYEFPLGKAISVALGLKTLGQEVDVIAFVGNGEIARYKKFLDEKGISHNFIPVLGQTRSNHTILDEISNKSTHIRYSGFSINEFDINNLEKRIFEILHDSDIFVFSGSFPRGMRGDYLISLTQRLRDKNCSVVIDTSGEPLKYILECNPIFIKNNLEEMNTILGNQLIKSQELERNPDEKMLKKLIMALKNDPKLQKFEGKYIILTLGEYGALFYNSSHSYHASVQISDSAFTIGCGDSFLAGLLVGLQQNVDEKMLLKMASAAGAANTKVIGAGIFEKNDYKSLIGKIKLKKLL